jgi:hypothetical protein
MQSPSSGPKNKPSNQSYLLHAGFLLGLLVDPEDEGGIFHRNVGLFSTDYMASCPK